MQIENLFELFPHKCAEGFNSIYQIIVKCGLKQQKKVSHFDQHFLSYGLNNHIFVSVLM